MEYGDKMKLQEKAADGAEAAFLLTEKFSGKWLDGVKTSVLDRLLAAENPAELVKIQADYWAALQFYNTLLSAERNGRMASRRLHEEQTKN